MIFITIYYYYCFHHILDFYYGLVVHGCYYQVDVELYYHDFFFLASWRHIEFVLLFKSCLMFLNYFLFIFEFFGLLFCLFCIFILLFIFDIFFFFFFNSLFEFEMSL